MASIYKMTLRSIIAIATILAVLHISTKLAPRMHEKDVSIGGPEHKLEPPGIKLEMPKDKSLPTPASHNGEASTVENPLLKGNLHWLNVDRNHLYDIQAVQRTQLRRLSRIKEQCNTLPLTYNGQVRGHLQFMSFRDTTWSVMPKTGSTNMLRMICILIGPKCNNITGYIDEHDYVPKFLKKISEKELLNYVGTDVDWAKRQFMFVIVRDPWHRLVSTFAQKVLSTNHYINLCSYHNPQFRTYQKAKADRKEAWKFQEFLEHCVLAQYDAGGVFAMEPHFKPQSISGAVCGINYNYIAKTKTMEEDLKVILPQYQVSNVTSLIQAAYNYRRPTEKSNMTSDIYRESWKSVESTVLKRLQALYKNDIAMFGYSLHPL